MTENNFKISAEQIATEKQQLRKNIFFLLLIVDPNTKRQYEYVDVNKVFDSVLNKLGGLNELLHHPIEIVNIVEMVLSAQREYHSPAFKFKAYRKLILDAGCEVLKIKEE